MNKNFKNDTTDKDYDYEVVEEDVVFEEDSDVEYVEIDDNGEEFYVEADEDVDDYEIIEEIDEFDDDDSTSFYHGRFPSPPPPMPFYFPPPVVPVNNHRFGRNFPPPPMRPILDPALRAEIEDAQNEFEEIEYEEFVSEDIPENQDSVQQEPLVSKVSSVAVMKSSASKKMLQLGQHQEAIVKSGRSSMFLISILKWVVSIIIVAVMVGACMLIVKSYFNTSDKADSKKIVAREAQKGDFAWRIERGRARTCLEDFYKALGFSENYIFANDLLMKGSISTKSGSDEIYCIKKRSSNSIFIKIGSASTAKAYSIGDTLFGVSVNHLLDGGMSGNKQELSSSAARIIRAITSFDDLIFARAFSRDFNNVGVAKDISYEGETQISGNPYQTLTVRESDGTQVNFYFDNKTSLLGKVSYKNNDQLIEIFYSDYKPIDDEQSRPFKRKIFVNGKLYADIIFDFIVARDGLIFPN